MFYIIIGNKISLTYTDDKNFLYYTLLFKYLLNNFFLLILKYI